MTMSTKMPLSRASSLSTRMTLTRPTPRSPQVQRMQPDERLHEDELELDDEEENSSISCGGADEVAGNTHLCCHSQLLQTAMCELRTSLPTLGSLVCRTSTGGKGCTLPSL